MNPDLIVLDLSMPVMNDLDAARESNQLMPAVPLIMYTLFDDAFVEQQARLAGVSELVSKSEPEAIFDQQSPQYSLPQRRVITSFPSRETQVLPFEVRQRAFDDLSLGPMITALRKLLEPITDCGFCGRDFLRESFEVRLYKCICVFICQCGKRILRDAESLAAIMTPLRNRVECRVPPRFPPPLF